MKENRNGIIICIIFVLFSLALSITFSIFKCNWFFNFSFAIMGSAILSFVICLINYITLRKKLIEELVNGLYVFNNDINTQLYLFNEKKDVGSLALAIGVASAHLTNLTYLAYSIEAGLFCFERKRLSITKEIIKTIENEIHFKVYSIGQFLQKEKLKSQKEDKYNTNKLKIFLKMKRLII